MSAPESKTDRTALGTLLIHIFALGFFIVAGLSVLGYVALIAPTVGLK